MDALTEWAAFCGILSRGAISPNGVKAYDAHVDVLLDAIENLSDEATAELVIALEASRPWPM